MAACSGGRLFLRKPLPALASMPSARSLSLAHHCRLFVLFHIWSCVDTYMLACVVNSSLSTCMCWVRAGGNSAERDGHCLGDALPALDGRRACGPETSQRAAEDRAQNPLRPPRLHLQGANSLWCFKVWHALHEHLS